MQRATITGLLAGAAALAWLIAPHLPRLRPDVEPDEPRRPERREAPDDGSWGDGALRLSASLDRPNLLRDASGQRYLVIEVKAPEAAGARVPVSLALVFDTSGSMMEDDRIAQARDAAQAVVSRLSPQDALALVTFDDQAWVRIPRTAALDPALFRQTIAGLMPGGGTNLYDGLVRGLDEVSKGGRSGARRVILLSDGEANIGVTEPARIVDAAAARVAEGVTVSALGVGLDFNEDLLADLTDASGGSWRFADQPGAISALLEGELDRMTRLVGQELTLEVELGEGVALDQVYGWSARRQSGGFQVFLGDLHAGETRKIVARVQVPTDEDGERIVGEARLRYHDLTEGPARQRATARGTVSMDAARALWTASPDRMRLVSEALAGDAIQSSASAWAEGRTEGAREELRQVQEELRELGQPLDQVPALSTWMEAVDTPMAEAEQDGAVKRAKEAARGIAR